MKIDHKPPQGLVSQKTGLETSKKVQASSSEPVLTVSQGKLEKKADISSQSQDWVQAKKIASETPDIREDRVMELKKQIDAGKYTLNPEKIADRLVDEHIQMMH